MLFISYSRVLFSKLRIEVSDLKMFGTLLMLIFEEEQETI